MALRAGQEVDAYCTKCKMDLTHRIVAVVGSKPVKVECRTCMQTHTYRLPKTSVASGDSGPRSALPSTRTARALAPSESRPRAPKLSRRSTPEEQPAMVPPPTARVHPYSMTERYSPDQWIVHKTFGIGLVLREIPPDKIEVRFDSGARTLAHNRSE